MLPIPFFLFKEEQLIKLSTTLVRGDRFNEGTLAWAFESGLLAAMARRAAALVGEASHA